MRPIGTNGQAPADLSERLANNVVEALVNYVVEPTTQRLDALNAYSTALSSLALLAVAEQLRDLVVVLTEDVPDGEEDAQRIEGMWP